ncbi:hypothetical protein KAI87_07675, partial [Myxococcota bacterium]|nr:hypothetical protein [Myxococcota bacterium]
MHLNHLQELALGFRVEELRKTDGTGPDSLSSDWQDSIRVDGQKVDPQSLQKALNSYQDYQKELSIARSEWNSTDSISKTDPSQKYNLHTKSPRVTHEAHQSTLLSRIQDSLSPTFQAIAETEMGAATLELLNVKIPSLWNRFSTTATHWIEEKMNSTRWGQKALDIITKDSESVEARVTIEIQGHGDTQGHGGTHTYDVVDILETLELQKISRTVGQAGLIPIPFPPPPIPGIGFFGGLVAAAVTAGWAQYAHMQGEEPKAHALEETSKKWLALGAMGAIVGVSYVTSALALNQD